MTPHRPATLNHTAPPTFRVALAERSVLLEQLRRALDRKVLLLEAPAGYGKTWLLGRLYGMQRAAGARVAWLGIEQADAAQFLSALVASFARAGVDAGRLDTLAAQGFADIPVSAGVAAIAQTLSAVTEPTYIFVDDIHRTPAGVVKEVLAPLIVATPDAVHYACSGRDCSALPKAALRTRGDLVELDAEGLRFGAEEARALFPTLDPDRLGALVSRTEGWPVALQLARLWLESKPGRVEVLGAFSGRTGEVAEYLTEQVLSDLTPQLLTMLEDVSILEQLNPDLVAAVTGSGSAWRELSSERRLEHFLVPLDHERYWFRLHHLLLDFLRDRLRKRGDDLRPLHSRAAGWYERHGELQEAIRHASLAGEVERAAGMLERTGGWELVLFGGTVRMRALLRAFPDERVADFPRVQLYQAFLAAKDGELSRGLRLYDAVAAAHGNTTDRALARDLLVVGQLVGRYADRPVGKGDVELIYRQVEQLPPEDDAGRASLLNLACLVALGSGGMHATKAACQRALKEMRRVGSVLGANYCLLHLGLAQLHSSERREAEATWREASTMAEENFGADSGLKAVADVHLALALHAKGDIAGAAERIAASLAQVESADGWLDLYAEGYEVAIANAAARGAVQHSHDYVERMKRVATARGLDRLAALATIFDARLRGDGACVPWTAGEWRSSPFLWRQHHAAGVAKVQGLLALGGRSEECLPVIDDLVAAATEMGRLRDLRIAQVLACAVRYGREPTEQVLRDLADSLESALREDDTQFLVDLGPVMLPLLQAAWSWSREHWGSARGRQMLGAVVTSLARAADRQEAPAVLSARELEVLVELAGGAPNKVIARNLQMNENTVKYHLKNIFQKLQVRHRAEALQAARSRGLLR